MDAAIKAHAAQPPLKDAVRGDPVGLKGAVMELVRGNPTRKVSERLDISRAMVMALARGFDSIYEYHRHLAEERGISVAEYQGQFLAKAGQSRYDYDLALAKSKGFSGILEYRRTAAMNGRMKIMEYVGVDPAHADAANRKGRYSEIVMPHNLGESRMARGLTQVRLGEMCGVVGDHIRNIEAGRVAPSVRLFRRMAAALDTEEAELFRVRDVGVYATLLGERNPDIPKRHIAVLAYSSVHDVQKAVEELRERARQMLERYPTIPTPRIMEAIMYSQNAESELKRVLHFQQLEMQPK